MSLRNFISALGAGLSASLLIIAAGVVVRIGPLPPEDAQLVPLYWTCLAIAIFAGCVALAQLWQLSKGTQPSTGLTPSKRRELLDSNYGVIVVDRKRRIRWMNPAAESLTGWLADEAQRKMIYAVFRVRGDAAHQVSSSFDRLLGESDDSGDSGDPVLTGCELQARDGRVRNVDVLGHTLRNASNVTGVMVIIRPSGAKSRIDATGLDPVTLDHTILDRLSDAVLSISDAGEVAYANAAALELFGYSAETICGAPIGQFLPVPFSAATQRRLAELSVSKSLPSVLGLRQDATTFPAELTLDTVESADGSGYIITVRDITERRVADNLATRLGRLLDYAGEEVYIYDAMTLNVLQVNRRVIRNLGYPRERLIRMTPHEISPKLDEAKFDGMLDKLRNAVSEHLTYQTEHRRADGSEYPVEVTLSYSSGEQPPVFMAIAEDISQRRAVEQRLEFLAHHDSLTELPNRFMFMQRLQQARDRVDRQGGQLALMFADLDLFKRVNDTLGHDAGDALLAAVGEQLKNAIGTDDLVARLAGDEFTMLITSCVDRKEVERLATQVLEAFEQPIRIPDHDVVIGMSIGIAIYPDDCSEPNLLLHHADQAMYEVKKTGRGAWRVFEPELIENVHRREQLEHGLRHAIALDDFVLQLAPVADVTEDRVIAAQVSLCWAPPDLPKVEGEELMRMGQQIGMLENIELWMMRAACAQYAQWVRDGLPTVSLMISLSTWQLRRRDFVQHVGELLERYKVPADCLIISVMEGGLLDVLEGVTGGFDVLRELGVRFNVNDFGSGYQRLGRMNQFPVEFLSLPVDVITALPDADSEAAIRPLLAAAASLECQAIAPAVQTQGAREVLVSMGCTLMHGPAVAPEVAADQFCPAATDALLQQVS